MKNECAAKFQKVQVVLELLNLVINPSEDHDLFQIC